MKKDKIIVILGPTASGKSGLAVRLANKFNGEVVSADSRQVYKGLDIGTGKIPKDKKTEKQKNRIASYFYKGIVHWMIDVVSPKKVFTVAEYQKLAKGAIADILKRHKLPIICGGTGFYIDAAIYDYPLPKALPNEGLREKLEARSTEELYRELKRLDPGRAGSIDRDNRRRLVRALEIVIVTGLPTPKLPERKSEYDILKIGIKRELSELKRLIFERLMMRLGGGMIREVQDLHEKGLGWERMEELGLEYRYVSRCLRGLMTKEQMIGVLNKEIWHYARRQMTWFRRDRDIFWIEDYKEAEKLVKEFVL